METPLYAFRAPATFFGWGAVDKVAEIARGTGKRALLLHARSARPSGTVDRIAAGLRRAGVEFAAVAAPPGEPTDASVDAVRRLLHEHRCDVLIAVGGGSVLDLGKCAAGLYASAAPTHVHMTGEADPPPDALPWIAVPTTAGSGAEMTPNAVIIDVPTGIKKSLRSWGWLARAAVVDPELTLTVPPRVTAYTGMDALTQAIESFISRHATPLTEAVSLAAAAQIGPHLVRAFRDGTDRAARTALAWGSMMAGLALANARLGAVHGFAHPVGTRLGINHGLACAVLLPAVLEYNLPAAEEKYARLAAALGLVSGPVGTPEAARRLLAFVRDLNAQLGVPPTLAALGLTREMIPDIVRETLPSGSLAANPRPATAAELAAILEGQLQAG